MNDPPSNPVETDIHCPQCDYNLTGSAGERCPWCGWKIDHGAIAAGAEAKSDAVRWSIIAFGFIVGVGSLIVLASLLLQGGRLSLYDGFAVLGVIASALGDISLAFVALTGRGRWPLRPGAASEILRMVGWIAVVAGVLAATDSLVAPPTQTTRGFPPSGVLTFVVTAILYSLPGCTLLVLRLVSFREAVGCSHRVREGLFTGHPKAGFGAPFSVDLVGHYSRSQLTQSWRDAERRTTPQVDALIEQTWNAQLAFARETNRILYNGELARLVGFHTTSDTLHLELGPTCFRDFLGTNLHNSAAVLETGAECLANALGISSTVITRDGFLALGWRASWVAFHAGFLHTFGGLLESADRRGDGSYDVFGAALRELDEELHVRGDEIAEIVNVGLVRDLAICQPELLFDVKIVLTREELSVRFDPAAKEQEHTGLEFVHDKADAILPLLARSARVAPVAQAALLLHGRDRWGTKWYDRACVSRFGEMPASTGQSAAR